MTPELQIKALAELDGWECFGSYTSIQDGSTVCWWFKNGDHFTDCVDAELPDYLESFDAIIPLIQKRNQHSILHTAFWETATPAHLCEELLRREGKWIED